VKLGILANLAPRKLSSGEGWLVQFAAEGRRRGHQVDLYCRTPVHPEVAEGLRAERAGLFTLDSLEASALGAIATLSGYDVLHLNLLVPRSRLALCAAAAYPAQVLYVAHSDYPPDLTAGPGRRFIRRALDRVSLVRAAGLAGVSRFIENKERARFGFPLRRSCILPVGVDHQRFFPRPRVSHPGVVLLGAAHLVRGKGFQHLLEALTRVRQPQVKLRLAGDGPESGALAKRAGELGLGDRVELLGLRNDLPELAAAADLFVQPTVYEAFGLAVAEAMACGLPVIASRVGGLPELVRHQETGLLVPPGDPWALAEAIDQLASQPEVRRRMGEAARRQAALFDTRLSAAQHLDWCERSQPNRSADDPGREQDAEPWRTVRRGGDRH
jgi:glycosyltransferase involved in cell wall biosynthesis